VIAPYNGEELVINSPSPGLAVTHEAGTVPVMYDPGIPAVEILSAVTEPDCNIALVIDPIPIPATVMGCQLSRLVTLNGDTVLV
jgi:hypothetical protein